MNSPHFVFVLNNFKMGGAERQAILLARLINQRTNAFATIIGLDSELGSVTTICQSMGIDYVAFSFVGRTRLLRFFQSMIRLTILLRRLKPDIILPYTTFPNAVMGLIWRFAGAQLCIWNQRNAGLNTERLPWRLLEYIALKNTHLFFSNSREGIWYLNEKMKVPLSKVKWIQNAFDPDLYANCNHSLHGLVLHHYDYSACMVANIHENKDHETLIKAWKIVVTRMIRLNKKALLILAGRHGSNYHKILELVKTLQLENNLVFLGEVKNVVTLYKKCDLCVLSSKSEGASNAILEAMYCNLPIVASDIPGIRNLISESNHSYLSKVSDPEDMADKIIKLLSNEQIRAVIAKSNKQKLGLDFSTDKLLSLFLSYITKFLNNCKIIEIFPISSMKS